MAYDYVTGYIYAATGSALIKIKFSPNGVESMTQVGLFTSGIQTIVFDETGAAYGMGIGRDNNKLYSINIETAETTLIGKCDIELPGGNASAAQSFAYDYDAHKLYWLFVSLDRSELYVLDRETGAIIDDCGDSVGWILGMFIVPSFDPVDREDAVTGVTLSEADTTVRVGCEADLICTVFPPHCCE